MDIRWLAAAALGAFAAGALAQHVSPYAGQEARDIKSLSPAEIDDLLAGKGMGLAKAAELNGFPGPMHVLELERPLALTPEQRERTQALFASMQARARTLGRALVDEEQRLDRLFASKAVTTDALHRALGEIGALQAKIRAAHLEAHLAQAAILTPEQNARYASLRGYHGGRQDDRGRGGGHGAHGGQHRH